MKAYSLAMMHQKLLDGLPAHDTVTILTKELDPAPSELVGEICYDSKNPCLHDFSRLLSLVSMVAPKYGVYSCRRWFCCVVLNTMNDLWGGPFVGPSSEVPSEKLEGFTSIRAAFQATSVSGTSMLH